MSTIFCPDCNEENFGSAEFCKKCGADFNQRPPYSRFLNRRSPFKTRPRTALLLNWLDRLEDFGGPWGWSLRLTRPAK